MSQTEFDTMLRIGNELVAGLWTTSGQILYETASRANAPESKRAGLKVKTAGLIIQNCNYVGYDERRMGILENVTSSLEPHEKTGRKYYCTGSDPTPHALDRD